MNAYIHRMDENAVPPRLIWSNPLRAPDVPKPVLGYPWSSAVLGIFAGFKGKKFDSTSEGASAIESICGGH
ncbi:hypothetical protein GQ600_23821 [Phytophthora cactorum]|nr:hypothetical protein GQ600_23821 [Phytophthora cactorum]